jgi:hypothetical protein
MMDAGRTSCLRGLVERVSARGKSALRWLAVSIFSEKGFHFWLANEHKFDERLKHEALIASANLAHERKTEAPLEFEAEFQKLRTPLDRSGRSLPMFPMERRRLA